MSTGEQQRVEAVRDGDSSMDRSETAPQVRNHAGSRTWAASTVVGFAVLGGAFSAPAFVPGLAGSWLFVASLTLVYALAAAGLNLILGYAGQISIAHGAFMGIGGYAVAILSVNVGLPFWVGLAVGTALGFLLGLGIGAPALRVTMHYLAMITLGVHVVFLLVAQNEAWLTGGGFGITDVPRPTVIGISTESDAVYHIFVACMVTLGLAGLYALLNSTWGRAFKAIRENDKRAEMLGINVTGYKLLAFAIGSAVAAFAGALLAPLLGFIDPTSFQLTLSFSMLLMIVVGGLGRFEGPLLGALIVTLLPEFLRAAQGLYLILFAALTLLLLVYMPKGLITIWDIGYKMVTGRSAPRLTK